MNKGSTVLRGSAVKWRINIRMCDQGTRVTRSGTYGPGIRIIKRVHPVTPDLIQNTRNGSRSTMRNVTLKHTPVRNWAPLTARSSSLRCVSAAKHYTAEQYFKKGQEKNLGSISQEVIYHGTLARTSSTYQVFKKLLY